MTKKQIKELVNQSYTNKLLDKGKVRSISQKLARVDLKQFIKALQTRENKDSVHITIPENPDLKLRSKIQAYFPKKKIVYEIDPTLNPGVKITYGDLLYEVSLKSRLEKLLSYIEQNND